MWENVVDVGASSSSIPATAPEKSLDAAQCVNVNHRPVGNPKRKV
jgi:hypothetical protein